MANETEIVAPPVVEESVEKKFLQLRCYQCVSCGENVSSILEPEDMEKMSCPNLKCDSNRPARPVGIVKAEEPVVSAPTRVAKSWVTKKNK